MWRTALFLVVVAGAWIGWRFYNQPEARADRLLVQARQSKAAGDLAVAEAAAAEALDLNPSLAQAAFLAADCAVELGEFSRAIEYAGRVKTESVELRLRALLLVARVTDHELHRMVDAEAAWRAVLAMAPDEFEANAELARLLFRCDRRSEATPYALRVLSNGQPTELLALMAGTAASEEDRKRLELARAADPHDSRPLTGLALLAWVQDRNDEAIALLREAIRIDPQDIYAHAALGQRLAESGTAHELDAWRQSLPEQAERLSEVWIVLGKMAEARSDQEGAIRCYWEACRRGPESRTATSRLAQLLAEVGRPAESEKFAERLRQLGELAMMRNHVMFSADSVESRPTLKLIHQLLAIGQFHEALSWCVGEVQRSPSNVEARQILDQLQIDIRSEKLQRTADRFNVALRVDLSDFPRPVFRKNPTGTISSRPVETTALSFRDDSMTTGLEFHYCYGTEGKGTQRMYELTGGGVGVLDYDLDGFADAYFTQGHLWDEASTGGPPESYFDSLFRNLQGVRFEEVSGLAGLHETGFGQGVTIGDFDSDGFPDVFVANTRQNQLWRNNGDGTFSDVTRETQLQGQDWTTSCVMADLTGDGHPDLYEVNYVAGSDIFERVCLHQNGKPRQCAPFHFDPAVDRLWVNDGEGKFVERTRELLSATPDGKGLGVAVWNSAGNRSLDLLVANDTTPNLLFRQERDSSGRLRLMEGGIAAGLAVNEDGKAEGCMGIAIGDVNDDGLMDALVTNFLHESNTLYLSGADGFFEDRTREQGLDTQSMDVLGFGTQFLDADLDGTLELFVANGHVADLSEYGTKWRMPAQLFRQGAGRFFLVNPSRLGEYFQKEWLGRAVARCDWNRDGKDDLFVGHLLDASSLLTNTSPDTGRFLSIRLFGVQSPRDAIGTTIEATIGNRTIVRQLTAGDGYQASNERRIIFGTGTSETIRKLVVRWPSGREQVFDETATNQEVWLVEGGSLVPNGP
ncbi:MAG: FG-GAP-like repeat-containing protein [Planctomycetota bacterium]|nr:FG-GAP-like repeat-containing protein [Planctomycetota bacterium]